MYKIFKTLPLSLLLALSLVACSSEPEVETDTTEPPTSVPEMMPDANDGSYEADEDGDAFQDNEDKDDAHHEDEQHDDLAQDLMEDMEEGVEDMKDNAEDIKDEVEERMG